MTYGFVLGRVYTLSLAEVLEQLLPRGAGVRIVDASFEILIIESPVPLDVESLQKKLGGIIKILKIVDVVKKHEQDSINFALQNYFKPGKLKTDFLKGTTGKIQFGVSIYLLDHSVKAFGEPKRLGMFIKRGMQDNGASIRLVLPEYNALALASVPVTHNQLIQKGAEICVVAGIDKVYVGKTLSVQDFEDYGRRDYQRPMRDEQRGMIPPKVAQSMLNLARVKLGDTLLDPFCGVGTFIQEGALLGFRMIGTDKDKLAVLGSEKNLEWFRNRYKIPKGKYHLEVSDARKASVYIAHLQQIKAVSDVSAIVTEGTLGPLYTKLPSPSEIKKNFAELQQLYKDSFLDFAKFLKAGARVVLCLPAYKQRANEYIMLPSLDFAILNGYNSISVISKDIALLMPFLRLTPRGSVIYDRKDQTVAREIVVFEKT